MRREAQRYLHDIELREEGGTPAIVESIRAGLVFQLKQAVGVDAILEREHQLCRYVRRQHSLSLWLSGLYDQSLSMAFWSLWAVSIHGFLVSMGSPYPWLSGLYGQSLSMAFWSLWAVSIHGFLVSMVSLYGFLVSGEVFWSCLYGQSIWLSGLYGQSLSMAFWSLWSVSMTLVSIVTLSGLVSMVTLSVLYGHAFCSLWSRFLFSMVTLSGLYGHAFWSK